MSEQAIRYLIGVDAGGTKTAARLVDLTQDNPVNRVVGPGSLTNDTDGACVTIKQLIESMLEQQGANSEQTLVICGAAGTENPDQRAQLEQTLNQLNCADTIVTTDAHISLLGVTGGDYGVCVAVGTGSIALRYDESEKIQQFGGWGFQVCDQGSGAILGREAVQLALTERDRGNVNDAFVAEILYKIGSERKAILQWLKQATPADYAALCPVVLAHQNKSDFADGLIDHTIAHVNRLIELARGDTNLPVYMTGGMSQLLMPYLKTSENESWLFAAKGGALDGALLLGRQRLEIRQD